MGTVKSLGEYVRDVPDTWEEHHSFHAYMKMYCGFTVQQSIDYAKKHLGPKPARVTVEQIEILTSDEDEE